MQTENYLYILVRTDLASMPVPGGKATAQACHAANQMVKEGEISKFKESIETWAQSANGFGTTITLCGGGIDQVESLVDEAKEYDLHAAMVIDPTYPLVDGDVVHQLELPTCAYIFGSKAECQTFLKDLQLITP